MANDAKKVSQLGITTTLSANDRVVVLTNPASSAQTQTITLSNLIGNSASLRANTSSYGVVKIGSGLSVNATGFLISSAANTGSITFTNNVISATGNNDVVITPGTGGKTLLDNVVFQRFANTDTAIKYIDNETSGKYGGVGNSSIYLDIAAILNDGGNYIIKGDGRFRYIANDTIAVQNTDFGHIILRTENNDKYIKVHNVTDNVGIEIRTDDHAIQLAPNNYVWEFTPQGRLEIPSGGAIKFSDNTAISGIPGPYTNDAAANTAGVVVKGLYYDASGNVKIRLT
jgi:hypothetical protein